LGILAVHRAGVATIGATKGGVLTTGLQYSSDLERILEGRLPAAGTAGGTSQPSPLAQPHLQGAAGFITE
jgi:hypothetical protein